MKKYIFILFTSVFGLTSACAQTQINIHGPLDRAEVVKDSIESLMTGDYTMNVVKPFSGWPKTIFIQDPNSRDLIAWEDLRKVLLASNRPETHPTSTQKSSGQRTQPVPSDTSPYGNVRTQAVPSATNGDNQMARTQPVPGIVTSHNTRTQVVPANTNQVQTKGGTTQPVLGRTKVPPAFGTHSRAPGNPDYSQSLIVKAHPSKLGTIVDSIHGLAPGQYDITPIPDENQDWGYVNTFHDQGGVAKVDGRWQTARFIDGLWNGSLYPQQTTTYAQTTPRQPTTVVINNHYDQPQPTKVATRYSRCNHRGCRNYDHCRRSCHRSCCSSSNFTVVLGSPFYSYRRRPVYRSGGIYTRRPTARRTCRRRR